MPSNLLENDTLVSDLRGAMYEAGGGLRNVPALLKRIIAENMWQERIIHQTGEKQTFSRFEEFVRTPPLAGLGSDIETLKKLCHEDPVAQSSVDKAVQNPHGGDRRSEAFKLDNVQDETEAPTGNRRETALRRLRKDRPDLHGRVLAKELSPHRAAVMAGFRRETITIPHDPERAAAAILRHFTPDECAEIKRLL